MQGEVFTSSIYYWTLHSDQLPDLEDPDPKAIKIPPGKKDSCYTLTVNDFFTPQVGLVLAHLPRSPDSGAYCLECPHGGAVKISPGSWFGPRISLEAWRQGGREAQRLEGRTRGDNCYSAQAPGTRSPFLALSGSQRSVTCVLPARKETRKKRKTHTGRTQKTAYPPQTPPHPPTHLLTGILPGN